MCAFCRVLFSTSMIWLLATYPVRAAIVWNGPTLHFDRPDGVDGTLPANQDQLTADVIFARQDFQGLYNAAQESGFSHSISPVNTEWENGTTASINPAAFTDWNTWFKNTNGGPGGAVGQPAVVHLIADDIYLDITFTSWSSHGAGGFAYDRSTPSIPSGPAVWLSATSGSWSAGANWSTGSAPNGAGLAAVLNPPTTVDVAITLDAPQTVGKLQFGNSASSTAGYTLSGDNSLTLDNSGSASLIRVTDGRHLISAPIILNGDLVVSPSAGSTLSISGNIQQNSSGLSLTLNDAGMLVLGGSNDYDGGTTVDAGTLRVDSPSAIANGTNLAVGPNASSLALTIPTNIGPSSSPPLSTVPEPSSLVLLVAGGIALLACAWRRCGCVS